MTAKRKYKPGEGFYSSHQWHKARSKAKARWKREGRPCAICHAAIDWTAKPVVDHIQPRRDFPDLAYEQTNLQVVCHGCNSKKATWSDNTTKPEIGLDGFPVGSDWSL